MNITEEVGLTARTFVEALKSAPAVLSLVVFNLIFLAMVGWLAYHSAELANLETQRWAELVRSCLPQR